MGLELVALVIAHETKVPELRIAGAFAVALQQEAKVWIVEPVGATWNQAVLPCQIDTSNVVQTKDGFCEEVRINAVASL